MRRLLEVLFWSVLAAAFIGPGTVTTAASAGADFGPRLAWALVFSTLACLVLQEASARLATASGRDLGETIRRHSGRSPRWRWAAPAVALAVVLGCAAYEAGNILGGVAGARLVAGGAAEIWTLLLAAVAGVLLWTGRTVWIARALGVMVAVMGAAFLWVAVQLDIGAAAWLRGALVPGLPRGAATLVIGLVGTTVVPYNLFLGSGLARDRAGAPVRFGLGLAIGLGGVISLAVMVVGAALDGNFGFARLAALLQRELGRGGDVLFAVGLCGAGLSSAITAPFAAAVCARGLLAAPDDPRWAPRGRRYRAVWLGVLLTGVVFGVSGVRPTPVIVLAQALNGILLPVVAVLLLLAVNDRRVMGPARMNGPALNAVSAVCGYVCLVLGVRGVLGAVAAVGWLPAASPAWLLGLAAAGAAVLAVPIWRRARAGRRAAAGA